MGYSPVPSSDNDRAISYEMVSLAHLTAIAREHGLPSPHELPEPWTGAASHVYPLGNVVIKIPFDRPDAIEAVTNEATIAPFVRKLGVKTPKLIVFDASREILPVPFTVFRRVDHAESLEHLSRSPASVQDAWEEAGRQIARVHSVLPDTNELPGLSTFRQSPEEDPRLWADELRTRGAMRQDDACWLQTLLDRLAPHALADVPLTLCHGDVNAANVLVEEGSYRFRALIDWAGSGWLDAAWDFSGASLDAVPFLLAGHRSVAPLPMDHTAEARILWCQVQMRLFGARKLASPETAQQQLEGYMERLRRFAQQADLAWSDVARR